MLERQLLRVRPRRDVDRVALRMEQGHQFEGQVRLPGPGIPFDEEDIPLPAEDGLEFRWNRPEIGRRFVILNHTASRPPAAPERMTLAALKACSNLMVTSGLHPSTTEARDRKSTRLNSSHTV